MAKQKKQNYCMSNAEETNISSAHLEQVSRYKHYMKDAIVRTLNGIHAKPAAFLIRFLENNGDYDDCAVTYVFNGNYADGRSFLELLSLGMSYGKQVSINVIGDGTAEKCLNGLVKLVESDLDAVKI